MDFSIIITTWNTPEYLDECLKSIYSQQGFDDFEILVGIDGCLKTKQLFREYKNKKNLRVFYFSENSGTYITKNNLIKETNGKYVLFFDSDDIMNPEMLHVLNKEKGPEVTRFKFKNFGNKQQGHTELAYGVFLVKKEILNKLVGFQNWICNADLEFLERANFNNINIKTLNNVLFLRRKHDKNLTEAQETNMKSEIRKSYMDYIENCKKTNNWVNPKIEIKEYYEI